jgi:hypothetical protein
VLLAGPEGPDTQTQHEDPENQQHPPWTVLSRCCHATSLGEEQAFDLKQALVSHKEYDAPPYPDLGVILGIPVSVSES